VQSLKELEVRPALKMFSNEAIILVLSINWLMCISFLLPSLNFILTFVSSNTVLNLYLIVMAFLFEPQSGCRPPEDEN
jgi:hypothetical protein